MSEITVEKYLTKEEIRVLDAFRSIREREHGELCAAVKNGRLVKLWTTDKWDLNEAPKLREVGGTL